MTAAAARVPIDPDLDLALRELSHVGLRLVQLEERLILEGGQKSYTAYSHLISQRDDALGSIAARAERLGVRPGSLRLFLAEYERLKRLTGRKPSLAQLQRAVIAANDLRRRDALERRAEQAAASFRANHAERAANDAEAAVSYLEASCAK